MQLFSQPPLLIFTKVPILEEGTVYIYIYILKCLFITLITFTKIFTFYIILFIVY